MEDLDYILALQLQKKFQNEDGATINKENQGSPNVPKGYKEYGIATNSKGNPNRKTGSQLEQTSSLNDPSWEVIDPTPDIFALFGAFNERFFWGKLNAVEVRWSPQMTSCAGLCYYQGKGGLCSVRLSEPLLKLRPRSDLINTLLHEMIHAYLFVTANNRDRDGHGPEFHKHMQRINKEAGTKITVYHTFHDEVRLYQQHWWRCNGPCQTRKPYFGWVKRAKNRAPGPYDFWWGDHQAECGGTYIKVKEPENYVNKNKKSKNSASGSDTKATKSSVKDIRSFFPQPSTSKSSDSKGTSSNSSSGASMIFGFNDLNKPTSSSITSSPSKTSMNSNRSSNIIGFIDLNSPTLKSNSNTGKSKSTNISGKHNKPASSSKTSSPSKTNLNSNPSSNIIGFVDLNSPSPKNNSNSGKNKSTNISGRNNTMPGRSNSNSGRNGGFVGGGLKNKGSSTLVIPPRTQTKTEAKKAEDKKPEVEKPNNPLNIDTFQAFKTNGRTIGGQVNDRSKSRLLSMFSNQKQSTETSSQQTSVRDGRRTIDCSSPPKKLFTSSADSKRRSVSSSTFDTSIEDRTGSKPTSKQGNLFPDKERSVDPCIPTSSACTDPIFRFKTGAKRRPTSTGNLLGTSSVDEERHSPNKKSLFDTSDVMIDVDLAGDSLVNCPVCNVRMKRYDLDHHLDDCCGLKNIFSNSVICENDDEDVFVEKNKNQETNLRSKKNRNEKPSVSKDESDLSCCSDPCFHLEKPCSSVINISNDKHVFTEEEQNHCTNDHNGSAFPDPKVPCPCCNKLIPNSKINLHLDRCLTEMAQNDLT